MDNDTTKPKPEPVDMDQLKREKLIEDHYATRAYLESWRRERGKI